MMRNQEGNFTLPDPALLHVHAAIARFLHMSDVGEHIDRIISERENIRCLAPDGSTGIGRLSKEELPLNFDDMNMVVER